MTFRVLGIAGSLRAGSHNRALLRAAAEVAPDGIEVVIVALDDIPLYNSDVEAAGDPPAVAALKEAIRTADALLLVTPEYNGGISGVMKNAIDWASRPRATTPLSGKPAGVMGASTGQFGAVWAQAEARKILSATGACVIDEELPVGSADDAFEADGSLLDATLRAGLADVLEQLLNAARAPLNQAA